MTSVNSAILFRPSNRVWALGLPLLLIAALLLPVTERLDFYLADALYLPGTGFIGKHSVFLEAWLHSHAKRVVILFGLLVLAGWLISLRYAFWEAYRRPLGYLVMALALSTVIVTPLKAPTAVRYPWDLAQYGGEEIYPPLLAERAPTLKPGRCWPGGHASSGFSLFALYFLFRDTRPRLARGLLVGALLFGSLLSLGHMLQGAHFLSHNLWTAAFDWLICLGCYRWLLYCPENPASQRLSLGDTPSHRPPSANIADT